MKTKEIDANGELYIPEEHKMNIYQRMSAITKELGIVAKNIEIQATKTSAYKAVSERDVIDAVKPLEARYGVFSYPYDRQVILTETLSNDRVFNGQTTTVYSKMVRIETVYRFVNVDDPADYIDIKTYGDGIDTGDKAPPKAMTFADKYALMKAYKISTGDDPDQTKSPDEGYAVKKSGKQMITEKQIAYIRRLIVSGVIDKTEEQIADSFGVETIRDLTMEEASGFIKRSTDGGNRIHR